MTDLVKAELMLVQLTGDYGPWDSPIIVLQGIGVGVSGIVAALGLAVLASAGGNHKRHRMGVGMLEGSAAGLVIVVLAEPAYRAIQAVVGF